MNKELNKLLMQLVDLHPKYIDLSLDRLNNLLEKLKNPHLKIPPVIHIAGTNGKGSVLSFLKEILIENNFKVSAYISPHLKNFNERIIISNKQISTKKMIQNLKLVQKINNNNTITFFEITTAAAFYLFSKSKADFLILETGLGGRLDATNVIKESLINIITPIGLDHQEFLGKKIEKITLEKLGIIKKNSNIIISKQSKKVKNFIKQKLDNKKNNVSYFGEEFKTINVNEKKFKFKFNTIKYNFDKPKLLGNHQIENAANAIAATIVLKKIGYSFSIKSINNGIKNTTWPGRLEMGRLKNITVFLDGAHNIDGAKQLLKFFNKKKYKIWIVFGMLNNKNISLFLKKLKPIINGIIAIEIPEEKNSYSTKEIYENCKKLKIKCFQKKSIKDANSFLIKSIKPKKVLVCGSLYLIGKVRSEYL